MDYFAALRAFLHAAEIESFSNTAEVMGVQTSTVSRYIGELEDDLGIALFNRSTHGLVFTGAACFANTFRFRAGSSEPRRD